MHGSQPDQPHSVSGQGHAARNRLVIALLLVSTFVVILNETIIGIALPHLMTDLQITASQAQWLSTAFMLTMAVVIPVTGFLLQRYHTRPMFMAAMILFSLGTLIAALAPGLFMLIVGRIVQAIGTAVMLPLLMTTVMNLVPPASRGKTMGNISIVISVAPAIGPTISGLILNSLDWRWMFWLVLPISLAALLLGALKIENVTSPRKRPFDIVSVFLAAPGFGCLVYGLSAFGETAGPGGHEAGVPAGVPTAAGAIIVAIFVWRQLVLQKTDRALLDLRTFATPIFTTSVILMAIGMMSMFGTIILLPIYMQNVLGLDPLKTGLLLLPGGLAMGLLAPFVGFIYDRHGPSVLIVPGATIASIAVFLMAGMNEHTSVAWLLALHIVFSSGLGLMFTPLFTASLGALPPQLYAHGSAVVGTVQQIAGAAGTAAFVAIMSYQSRILSAAGASAVVATAGGIGLALSICAAISALGVLASLFIRRSRDNALSARDA